MTKTKTPKLSTLIEAIKFDWVNSDITDDLFATPKEVSTDYRIFDFGRNISSEEAIKEMEKDGYRPANAWELLGYAKIGWNNKDLVVALGSVGGVGGGRDVPYLRRVDSGRDLDLGWWGSDWGVYYRFLGVRNLSSDASVTLTLTEEEARVLKGIISKMK